MKISSGAKNSYAVQNFAHVKYSNQYPVLSLSKKVTFNLANWISTMKFEWLAKEIEKIAQSLVQLEIDY